MVGEPGLGLCRPLLGIGGGAVGRCPAGGVEDCLTLGVAPAVGVLLGLGVELGIVAGGTAIVG
jgi:hypothetical protein